MLSINVFTWSQQEANVHFIENQKVFQLSELHTGILYVNMECEPEALYLWHLLL